ncbi:DUF4136 domain-containing protein [Zhongshania guokunii]|uniref:DUF4136 domain-containing protein n=1 Tax=Zhongshania guokunii TaxID=641783 RepID=A0ABV3U2K8_9GAMM
MKNTGLALLFVLLSACAGLPVSTDYALDYDFTAISTFAWLPVPASDSKDKIKDASLDNDLVRERVLDAVDAELAAKGLILAADGMQPSVLVAYHLGKEDKVNFNSFGSWYTHFAYYPCYYCDYQPGYGRGYFGHGHFYDDDIWVRSYEESSLMIDIIDPVTKKLVWRGTSKRVMPSLTTPEERRQYIRETVAAVLAKFPPAAAVAH